MTTAWGRWELDEGGYLRLRHPRFSVHWQMPEGYALPSPSVLSLAEAVLLHPYEELIDVVPRHAPSGDRTAVAFSGGVDSAAALRLLPDPIPIHSEVLNPAKGHVLENALLAVEEVGGLAIRTDYDMIAPAFERRRGFFGPGTFTVTSILLADHFGISTVADGNTVGTVYLLSEHGHGTLFNPRDLSWHREMFGRAGMHYALPCGGLSEVSTAKFVTGLRYAMSCMRGSGGLPCLNCMKCYRKLALKGAPISAPAQTERLLSKEYIPSLSTLLWCRDNVGLRHPALDAIERDISWVDGWFARSLEHMPSHLQPFFLARLEEAGISPIKDETPLLAWTSKRDI